MRIEERKKDRENTREDKRRAQATTLQSKCRSPMELQPTGPASSRLRQCASSHGARDPRKHHPPADPRLGGPARQPLGVSQHAGSVTGGEIGPTFDGRPKMIEERE
ncbi:hypothetical protein CRENBAI_010217 [Crenichthys baileyi]|uniref:Uncharacterized protein n=1 Tax=Crenichthys baileyi TaxID=28760 RepID=A0AAV9RKR1_9TELE